MPTGAGSNSLPGELRIALLLPGQGAQYAGMASSLYGREEVFTRTADEFFAHYGPNSAGLRQDWLAERPRIPIDHGVRAQPLLFMIDLAVAEVLRSRGLRVEACIGHSVGELAAAGYAGVFDLATGARILAARSRALRFAPAGGMLAVAAERQAVEACLDSRLRAAGLVVGAVNTPSQTVLCGPEAELTRAAGLLAGRGLVSRRVRAREPFHSPVLGPVADRFERDVAGETLAAPRIPIWSARTGAPVSADEAIRPGFWTRQLAEPVLFWQALDGLLDQGRYLLVEAGPGRSLTMAARRHPRVRSGMSATATILGGERGDTWAAWRSGLERLDEVIQLAQISP